MKMPAKKNNSRNATMLAAALALAACDREDKPAVDMAATPVMQAASEAHLPTVVEQRHFAIYNTYRVLSDNSSNEFRSLVGVKEESVLQVVAALDSDISTCSMHTLLLQD